MRLARIPPLLAVAVLAVPAALPAAEPRQVAEAIRDQAKGQLDRFYAGRGYWPLWASTGRIGPEAETLIGYLDNADLDGLRPGSYRTDQLRDVMKAARSGDAAAVARADLALSDAYARYVADMRRPTPIGMKWLDPTLKPHKPTASTVLRAAALRRSLPDYLATMGWMSSQYVRLRGLLAQARKQDAPEASRERLLLNLDRARMLPGPWVRHVVVDAASARLFWYQDGRQQGVMKVVAGTAETPTPMLAGMVRYAILNPYWNLPVDLVRKKFAPRILAGQSTRSLRFEAFTDWSASAKPLDPDSIDWKAVAAGRKTVRLRQLPGGSNAMGRVKYMFPNEQGIYLHDTPDKALMAKPDRHFSNGCVRLENAPALGKWLLGKPLATTRTPEQAVALPAPVPVYLTYLTATPTKKGFGFLKDVYKRDE